MLSRSAVEAFCTALPETNRPALAKAPVSKPVRSVSDCTRWIRDGVVPSTLAAICTCAVEVPSPNSTVPTAIS